MDTPKIRCLHKVRAHTANLKWPSILNLAVRLHYHFHRCCLILPQSQYIHIRSKYLIYCFNFQIFSGIYSQILSVHSLLVLHIHISGSHIFIFSTVNFVDNPVPFVREEPVIASSLSHGVFEVLQNSCDSGGCESGLL